MESVVLLLFALVLIGCMALGVPLLLALVIGYAIFFTYALTKGHSPAAVFKMSLSGIRTVRNILILFFMIGMLTALWRTGGTIPAIIYYAAGLVQPSVMILMAFLLNCLVSFLTGTAFGTAATMGVISMTMAMSMGMNPVITGGAILSGVFFGDRCSPVSTSALLVAELTKTDIFTNIKLMVKTSVVPFILSCVIYLALGASAASAGAASADVQSLFAEHFHIGFLPLLPAIVVLALALCRVNVKVSMLCSIIAAFFVSLFYQKAGIGETAKAMVLGFHSASPELAAMLDGGGIISMVRVGAIVCLSSSYAGIFEGVRLLDGLKSHIERLSRRTFPFVSLLIASAAASMIACNQTLAIMLTHQTCDTSEPDSRRLAIMLENTAVVIAPLVPWSIAAATPLASAGAPLLSIAAAFYLYLVPLWNLMTAWRRKTPSRSTASPDSQTS